MYVNSEGKAIASNNKTKPMSYIWFLVI